MEPVRARDVSMNGREVSGRTVEDDEWGPALGFSWSLYFAQSVNEHALHEVEGIPDVSVMKDRRQPCVLDISNPGRAFRVVYVDNLGLLSLSLSLWTPPHARGVKSLQNDFGAVGLRAHVACLGEAADYTRTRARLSPTCHQGLSCSTVATSLRARCFVETESRAWSHC